LVEELRSALDEHRSDQRFELQHRDLSGHCVRSGSSESRGVRRHWYGYRLEH
jgi:hypothetical protein